MLKEEIEKPIKPDVPVKPIEPVPAIEPKEPVIPKENRMSRIKTLLKYLGKTLISVLFFI